MSLAAVGSDRVTVRVPGKINLELAVGPLRDDGFHSLSTVFHAVSVYDDITVSSAPEWQVSVRGPFSERVPADASNLALRAARLLSDRVGAGSPVHVEIDKDIPVAGGMAGGSADAAATLVACEVLWGLDGDRSLLEETAALLGSDVNFCLTGGTAIGSGRGRVMSDSDEGSIAEFKPVSRGFNARRRPPACA